jgi:hypothetical protein
VVKPAANPFVLSLKLTGAAVIYLAISFSFSGLRPDWLEQLHRFSFVAEIITLTGIFFFTSLSVALLGFPDQFQKRKLAMAPIWIFVLFLIVIFFAAQADNPPAPLPLHSFQCTLSITLMAVLPAVWTFYFLRRYASTHYRLAGIFATLSAFSVGALWLRFYEATDSISHVVEWHYLPMLAVSFVGYWLGKRLLNW